MEFLTLELGAARSAALCRKRLIWRSCLSNMADAAWAMQQQRFCRLAWHHSDLSVGRVSLFVALAVRSEPLAACLLTCIGSASARIDAGCRHRLRTAVTSATEARDRVWSSVSVLLSPLLRCGSAHLGGSNVARSAPLAAVTDDAETGTETDHPETWVHSVAPRWPFHLGTGWTRRCVQASSSTPNIQVMFRFVSGDGGKSVGSFRTKRPTQ